MDIASVDKEIRGTKFSHLHVIILAVMVAVVMVLAWSTWSARSLMLTFVPQVNAVMQSRISLTESHLWLEEIVSGDVSENPQQVWDKIGEARWYVDALLNGGERNQRSYLAVADAGLRLELEQSLVTLQRFEEMARERVGLAQKAAAATAAVAGPVADVEGELAPVASGDTGNAGPAGFAADPSQALPVPGPEAAGVGTALDQQFDEAFEEYFARAEDIEQRLLVLASRALDMFIALQLILMAVVVALFAWIVWLLLRKEALQRDQHVSELQASLATLARNGRELERQNAQRGAMVELAASLQGLDNPVRIAETALRELCARSGAQVGLFWGCNVGQGLLRLAAHALPVERAQILTLAEGEGLAGRAANDQQPLAVDIPSDYLPVTSGLGAAAAPHLRVIPLVHDGTTAGVLELVFLAPPDEFVDGLLAAAAPAIAVRLHMASAQGLAA